MAHLMKVCVILILGTLSVSMWQKNTKCCSTRLNQYTVRRHYPSLFRSPTEQAAVEGLWKLAPTKTVTRSYVCRRKCAFRCWWSPRPHFYNQANNNMSYDRTSRARNRRPTWTEHGCCTSTLQFHAPTTLDNTSGIPRRLLQYTSLKQYLPKYICLKSDGCTGCTCKQDANVHAAVVLKHGVYYPMYVDHTELDWFYLDGCCKCVI